MQTSISYLTFGVIQLPRARQFYQALGWQELPKSNDDVAFFTVNDFTFALYSLKALSYDACFTYAPDAQPRVTLSHNTDSQAHVDTLLNQAVQAGATLLRAPGLSPWGGYRDYFADPEGLVWELCYNPKHKKKLSLVIHGNTAFT